MACDPVGAPHALEHLGGDGLPPATTGHMQLLSPRLRLCFLLSRPISAHLTSAPGTGRCQRCYLLSLYLQREATCCQRSKRSPAIVLPAPGRTPACESLPECCLECSGITSSLFT